MNLENISGILIRLTVGGARYMEIRLTAQGEIERGGQGERGFEEHLGNRDLFDEVLGKVSPSLLRWADQSWSDPSLRGKACDLRIAFRDARGRESITRWEYGTDSSEPPEEIRGFVLAAVEATNSWYRRQIETRHQWRQRNPGAAWRLVPLLTEANS